MITTYKLWIVRFFSVFFWVILIVGMMYLPRLFTGLNKQERSISVASWTEYINEQKVREFEGKTGIRVYVNFYENNEELLSKLEISHGHNYDLIIPTDFMTQILINKNLLKKIDRSKLLFWKDIDTRLLGLYYDPNNEYSIPYYWDIFGIGYDKSVVTQKLPQSWSVVFDPAITPGHVGMTDDAKEVVSVAADYLFGTIKNLTKEQLNQVKKLLIAQKKWVEAYSDLRGEFLLFSKTSPAALMPSAQVWQGRKSGMSNIGFIASSTPFIIVDNIVIPQATTKEDLVYQFINFLYEKDVLRVQADKQGYFPVRKDLLAEREQQISGGDIPTIKSIDQCKFFENTLPFKALNELWIAVKAS
jgi:spermidine/putrescine transport system substrate-binding protein